MKNSIPLFCVLLSTLTGPSFAQGIGGDQAEETAEAEQKSEDYQRAAVPGMFMDDMSLVNYMIDQNAFRSALEKLEEMREEVQFGKEWLEAKAFGELQIVMMIGYVHSMLNEYEIAIEYYEQVLAHPVLNMPDGASGLDQWTRSTRQNALYTLASLLAQDGDYERAIALAHEWFQGEQRPAASAYMMLGNLYVAVEQFEEALPYMNEALARSEQPIESWYRSTMSVQLQLELNSAAIENLKTMLAYWSDRPNYWETLARLHANNGDTRLAFDTVMSAHANDMLDTRYRVMMLVQLSVSNEVPYAGAQALESSIEAGVLEENRDNLDVLIDTWTYAREYDRAIEAIDRIAAYADPAPYYLMAARLYLQSADWQGAIDSAQQALDNDIEDRARTLTIMGMANLELQNYDLSLAAFRQILEAATDREKENAQNWINFVVEASANRELLSASQ